MQTSFQAYYTALKLNSLQKEDALMPVFSDDCIEIKKILTSIIKTTKEQLQ